MLPSESSMRKIPCLLPDFLSSILKQWAPVSSLLISMFSKSSLGVSALAFAAKSSNILLSSGLRLFQRSVASREAPMGSLDSSRVAVMRWASADFYISKMRFCFGTSPKSKCFQTRPIFWFSS